MRERAVLENQGGSHIYIYMYMYMYICIYVYIYMYIYMYREREREREREGGREGERESSWYARVCTSSLVSCFPQRHTRQTYKRHIRQTYKRHIGRHIRQYDTDIHVKKQCLQCIANKARYQTLYQTRPQQNQIRLN